MIQVNLLPVREARRQANMRQQMLVLAVAAGIGALVCVWLQISVSSSQAAEDRRIQQARVELKELEGVKQQVERFRKEKDEIEKKLAVINTLERARQGPVRLMDEIATRIPKRIWLTEMSMSGGTLQLQGVSLDAEIVAAFLASLAESDLISNVELDETRLTETDGLKLNSFKIHASYRTPSSEVAAAQPATQGRGRGRK